MNTSANIIPFNTYHMLFKAMVIIYLNVDNNAPILTLKKALQSWHD